MHDETCRSGDGATDGVWRGNYNQLIGNGLPPINRAVTACGGGAGGELAEPGRLGDAGVGQLLHIGVGGAYF